jgi:DNA-binding NarL/FixJ family response regulator
VIRIILVEDEPMWQQGIAALLSMEEDLILLSTVDNAQDALIFCEAEQPDIVLLDWKIKGDVDGIALGHLLAQTMPPHRLILVTGSPVDQIPDHPFGLVPKPQIASQLVERIRQGHSTLIS